MVEQGGKNQRPAKAEDTGQAPVSALLRYRSMGCWEAGHKDPWLVLTDLPPEAADACG